MATWYNTLLTMTDTKAIVYHLLLWGKPADYNVWLNVSEGNKMKAFVIEHITQEIHCILVGQSFWHL